MTTTIQKLTSLTLLSASAFLGVPAAMADTPAEKTANTEALVNCYMQKSEDTLIEEFRKDPASVPKNPAMRKEIISLGLIFISEHQKMKNAVPECVAQIMHVDLATAKSENTLSQRFDLDQFGDLLISKQIASVQNVLDKMEAVKPQPN